MNKVESFDSYSKCRICLVSSEDNNNLIDIFSVVPNLELIRSIASIIMECAPVQIIPNDGLPESICPNCVNKLLSAYEFRDLCLQSDYSLRQHKISESAISTIASQQTKTIIKVEEVMLKEDPIQSTTEIKYAPVDQEIFFKCTSCNKEFSTRCELKQHEFMHPGLYPYSCSLCIRQFKQKSHLKYHMDMHKEDSPSICEVYNEDSTKNNLKMHIDEQNKNNQKPTEGNEIYLIDFKTELHLQTNIPQLETNSTNKKTNYQCDECDKEFENLSKLRKHKRIHKNGRPFLCYICKKSFSRNELLKRHIQHHSGNKSNVCEICNKSFFSPYGLKTHMRTHTGERPFVCDICDRSYKQLGALVTHKRTHTGERPFVCTVCGKQCNSICDLNKHAMVHSDDFPYKCDVCNKGFKWNSNLTKHKRMIHSGEKPYQCLFCSRNFSDSSILKKHLPVHSNARPYNCDLCDSKFKRRSALRKHKLRNTCYMIRQK